MVKGERQGRGLIHASVLTALAVVNLFFFIVTHRGFNLILAIVWFMSSIYWWVTWDHSRKGQETRPGVGPQV